MSHIIVDEAQAWADTNKLDLGLVIDGELEGQVSTQILARVATAYNVSSWLDSDTTPDLIKTVIAMYYVAWLYMRKYSDDNDDENAYARKLMEMAEAILANILAGLTLLPGEPIPTVDSPSFYPTDLSSASTPTFEDPSLGPASFSMGQVF